MTARAAPPQVGDVLVSRHYRRPWRVAVVVVVDPLYPRFPVVAWPDGGRGAVDVLSSAIVPQRRHEDA